MLDERGGCRNLGVVGDIGEVQFQQVDQSANRTRRHVNRLRATALVLLDSWAAERLPFLEPCALPVRVAPLPSEERAGRPANGSQGRATPAQHESRPKGRPSQHHGQIRVARRKAYVEFLEQAHITGELYYGLGDVCMTRRADEESPGGTHRSAG